MYSVELGSHSYYNATIQPGRGCGYEQPHWAYYRVQQHETIVQWHDFRDEFQHTTTESSRHRSVTPSLKPTLVVQTEQSTRYVRTGALITIQVMYIYSLF